MTATEELHCLLDERGVEYETFSGAFATKTCWPCANGLMAIFVEYDEGTTRFEMSRWHVAPEEAIAATLWPEMSEELKPCPFCGGKAEHFGGAGYHSIRCTKCGITNERLIGGHPYYTAYDSVQEAIDAWNRRDG